jgi:hypothetical protein
MADRLRGMMVEVKKDEVFDIDLTDPKNAEDCYAMLAGGRAIVVDPAYIPLSAKYTVVYAFSYKTQDGFSRSGKPGDEVELDQEQAAKSLASGHIKPADPNQWTMRKLLGLNLSTDKEKIKKMYDEPIPQKESWIRKGMRDENR